MYDRFQASDLDPPAKEIVPLKNTAKRRIWKWFSVRAAALTFLITLLVVYGVCVYIFQDFVFLDKPGHDAPSEKVLSLAPQRGS